MIKKLKKNAFVLNKSLFKNKAKIFLTSNQKINIKRFKRKIQLEEYEFEEIDCEYCKDTNSIIISEYDRYGLPYRSNLCKSCGLVYTSPRLKQKSYEKFYNELYREIYSNALNKNTDEDFYQSQINYGRLIYDYISRNQNINKIK